MSKRNVSTGHRGVGAGGAGAVCRVMVVSVLVALPQAAPAAGTDFSAGRSYYLAPTGRDEQPGTLEAPWRTLRHAVTRLAVGDTLFLRAGRYHEGNITVGLQGTVAEPITIQSYPGERAVIDGSVPDFSTAPNTEWELVDSSLHLYRSRRTFSGSYVGAWLLDHGLQLIAYEEAGYMESTNYININQPPIYMGPGVQLRGDGRVYIRLQQNPYDLTDSAGAAIPPVPSDPDPNHNRLAVLTSQNIFVLDGAAHVRLRDLDLVHARRVLELRNGTGHVELDHSVVKYGQHGVLAREAHDVEVHHCDLHNGMPDWVYWQDVKGSVGETPPESPQAYNRPVAQLP